MSDGDVLRTCDHCGQMLEEDDELVPVWLGHLPKPDGERVKSVAEKRPKTIGYDTGEVGLDTVEVMNRPLDELELMLSLIEKSDMVDLNIKRSVYEHRAVGGETHFAEVNLDDAGMTRFESRRDDMKVGGKLTVQPQRDEPDPDLMVCEYCEESISGEGDS